MYHIYEIIDHVNISYYLTYHIFDDPKHIALACKTYIEFSIHHIIVA